MKKRVCIVFLGVVTALSLLAGASSLAAQEKSPTPADENQDEQSLIQAAQMMRKSGMVQFNFTEIDIVKFIRFMSELLQENIIVTPSVKGKVSVISPKPVPLGQARQVMLSVLEMNGLSIENLGAYSKVLPGKVVSTEDAVRRGKMSPAQGEQTVTQVVPLDFVTADFVVKAIQMAIKNVGIIPAGKGNDIVLSGKAVDVNRAVNLIRKIDVAESYKMSRTVEIKFSSPSLVAGRLTELAKSGPLQGLLAVADEGSKKIVLVGESDVIKEAQRIIRELDVYSRGGDFHIYKLEHADAKKAAEQLGQVLAVAAKLQPSKEGQMPTTVVPDLSTNSLIFAVPQYQYDSLLAIIRQIDTQPKQVMIRGLVCEVNLTKLDNAGIDWATFGGGMTGDAVLAAGASLGETSVPDTVTNWFTALTKTEVNIGTAKDPILQTTTDPKGLIYASIQMLKKFDAINVLSMPRLLCTDNMTSEFQVGQVIPQLKGQTSDITNPKATQNSYEYKDTGLILSVTPHIRSGNLVVLDINQKTEDVLTAMTATTPVTAKREIKTSVIVGNGKTVILGGLLKETEKTLKNRVPGLSYIPLLGSLFTKTSKQKEKIDFMVFLTPYIINTPEEAQRFTEGVAVSQDHGLSPAEMIHQLRIEKEFRDSVKKMSK
jgi:general secretion pathway protein D